MSERFKHFDEFYYLTKNENRDLIELAKYVNDNGNKLGPYEGNMFCPECREAELYFVHRTSRVREHLRRCPTSKHNDNCTYNYQYASKHTVTEVINSMTHNEVEDKLNSIINMLFKTSRQKKNSTDDGITAITKSNPMMIYQTKSADRVVRVLRRKKLNVWVDDEDVGNAFVFYGKVKLEVEARERKLKNRPSKYYCLKVYNVNEKGELIFRTSLYRGEIKDNISVDDLYYIAIIGCIGKKGWQIDMVNKNAVKYCKCET